MKLRRNDLLHGVSLHSNFTVFGAVSDPGWRFWTCVEWEHKLGVSLMLYFAKDSGCISILFS